MAYVHGKLTVIKLGAVTVPGVNNSEFSRKADKHDVSAYGNDDHAYAGGLGDGTFSMEGTYDNTAATGPRAVIEPLIGTLVTLTRQPEGTGAGKAQDVVQMLVEEYVETNPVADMVKWSMKGQLSGSVNSTPQS